jgi:hypothetical protein
MRWNKKFLSWPCFLGGVAVLTFPISSPLTLHSWLQAGCIASLKESVRTATSLKPGTIPSPHVIWPSYTFGHSLTLESHFGIWWHIFFFSPTLHLFFFSSFVGSSSSRNTWSLSSLKASCSLLSLDPCAFPSFLEYCFHPSPSLLSSTHVSSLNSKIYQFRDTSLDSANQLISPFCLLLILLLKYLTWPRQ